ncbi:unnamed protein product [Tenebrio molitor]|nr:unnamed protein product [Tenebrio molitor]
MTKFLASIIAYLTSSCVNWFMHNRVKNILLPRIRTFREIIMLCVTRIFKSNFECLRLVIIN